MPLDLERETQWVLQQLDALGQIGASPSGGRTRLALTPADEDGRRYVAQVMAAGGLQVREDAIGNLFGRLDGTDPSLPPLLIGSHIDTVPNAGRYDGCLGVLAAIAAARILQVSAGGRLVSPRRSVEVVAFTGEESSRFGLALVGSRFLAGQLQPEAVDWYRDADGISLGDCLKARGLDPADLPQMAARPGRYSAYIELHIDQGAYLDEQGVSVGIVTGIAAPLRLRFVIRGEAVHSGAAPPTTRRDALFSAGHVLVELERLAKRELPFQTVATVGRLEVRPNAINVVPGEVEFTADIRGVDAASRRRLARAMQRSVARVAAQRDMDIEVQVLAADDPVMMDAGLQDLIATVAADLGVATVRMPSMAGHDAMQVARLCPAALIFVRNRSRISHNPREETSAEDVAAGIAVLAAAVQRLVT